MEKTVGVAGWLVVALVALVVGVVSALEVREAMEREREFLGAAVCTSVPVTVSACVWDQAFTVRRADTHQGERGKEPEATLLLPTGKAWQVAFPNADPVVSEMEPGDSVVGAIWHGQVIEVRDADGRRQQTTSSPVGWPADRLGGALACISFGLTALVGSLWALIVRHDRRHARAAAMVRWHGVALGLTALLTLWAQSDNDRPIWAIPAIWGPFALILLATMVVSAVAALHSDVEGDDLSTQPAAPSAPPPAGERGVVAGAEDLPREYRVSRGRKNGLIALLVCKTALLLFLAWTEEIIPSWLKLGLSVVLPLFLVVIVVRVPRSGTQVDSTGIRIRGITHTRRVAWEEIQEIRSKPLRGADSSLIPRVIAYAYLTGGRRKLLLHLNDTDYDIDHEIAVLRAALAELRGRDSMPNAPVA
ncbi:PH domain-containing protein [Streptomyces sp. NPDC003038]|uniref:PH domain-containing protein n=1 Tax=unclassified Streptomyces TaxID=2593676 RepID=UPI0033B453B6